MTDFLLAISIGPVQPFIAAARKTRDFWCGSALLSQIAREAANELQRQEADLIFPSSELFESDDPKQQDLPKEVDADVANKLLAIVSGSPGDVANKVEEVARNELLAIAAKAFADAGAPKRHEPKYKLAIRQLEHLLEVYWAAVPLESKNEYSAKRALVEHLLAARKNTRDFKPIPIDEELGREHKCAIDGQREAVAQVPTGERDRSEPLCGVCLVKRFAFGTQSWSRDTTTHFAAKPFVAAAEKHGAFDAFRSKFKTIPGTSPSEVEASYLFEERLECFFTKPALEEAQKALRTLKDATRAAPSPYYALLRADGDRMGKAISACKDSEAHKALSERLVAFTKKARETVHGHDGRVVYAGGDDVLALLPVDRSVECAQALAKDFSETVTHALTNVAESERPTLSVGLVIAHHLDPLTDVVELSHKAEHAAKKHRNALAVLISKRSGSEYLASGTWGTFDETLLGLIEAFRQYKLPRGLPHELAKIAVHTRDLEEEDRRAIEEAELQRVLTRKRADKGDGQIDEKTMSLVQLLATEPERKTLSALVNLLGVARELASMSQGGDR